MASKDKHSAENQTNEENLNEEEKQANVETRRGKKTVSHAETPPGEEGRPKMEAQGPEEAVSDT